MSGSCYFFFLLFLCINTKAKKHLHKAGYSLDHEEVSSSSGTTGASSASGSHSSGIAKQKFSSMQCIGATQALQSIQFKQAAMQKFPVNEAEHRTCLLRDVCVTDGQLFYYVSEHKDAAMAGMKDYLPEGFDNGKMFHTGHLRGFTMPIKTIVGAVPHDGRHEYHHSKIAFLDANSWSFNYGHYFIDNVIPTFASAMVFNIPFNGTQQVIETNCRLFSSLEEGFSARKIDYNHSLGTYRSACLGRFDTMWQHFFDNPPIYVDRLKDSKQGMCFKKLMVGQGSTFGLKSLDLSRAIILREFRSFVLSRVPDIFKPLQENIVLVGLRVQGSAGGALIQDLCGLVKKAMSMGPYEDSYKVVCVNPSDLGLYEEIKAVQRAKVIVSVHGTISYMALFTRDGTQQISIANPKELKENQMLLYATHFHTLYLTWDRIQNLAAVLEHSIFNSEKYFYDN